MDAFPSWDFQIAKVKNAKENVEAFGIAVKSSLGRMVSWKRERWTVMPVGALGWPGVLEPEAGSGHERSNEQQYLREIERPGPLPGMMATPKERC